MVAEIQERHKAVQSLEASLLELHQIFLDMAVLVEQQGELLNNIDQQVCMCMRIELICSGCIMVECNVLVEQQGELPHNWPAGAPMLAE